MSTRILLVDDFEPWRVILRSLLQGHPELKVVGEAIDGEDAVEKARELKPDVILMDMIMPRLNGIEAAERIREFAPQSKILFVAVEQSEDFKEAAYAVGAKGFIPKAEVETKLLPALAALRLKK
jgi:DNA-binding NarL/FixJ family response regulator